VISRTPHKGLDLKINNDIISFNVKFPSEWLPCRCLRKVSEFAGVGGLDI